MSRKFKYTKSITYTQTKLEEEIARYNRLAHFVLTTGTKFGRQFKLNAIKKGEKGIDMKLLQELIDNLEKGELR